MDIFKHKSKQKTPNNDDGRSNLNVENVPFLSNLTDVGLYSVGGLCAVSLIQLFQDDIHSDFRKKALGKILAHLGQPKQANDSMFAILDGDVMDNCDAFVDAILGEEYFKETRQPLITDLIALIISDGCYDARMRVLIKHVAWQLRVTWDEVEEIECDLSETLEYNTYVMSEEEAKEKAKKVRNRKIKRYALIGLATVGGGALIGLTGGLAAPLVAAGAGAVIGTAGAAALGSAAGVAIIGSLFGVAGAGLTGYKMKRRMGAIEEFAFEPLTLIGSKFDSARTVKQLHITIAVTGWLNDNLQDFRKPWSALAECREQYSLRWESKYLYQLGEAFDYILQSGLSLATTEALKYTILSGLITAVAWPAALMSAAGAIDNPWHVCTQRATETGKQLAEVLLAREQGNRPVTLIGFSMGSRVIFACLEEMAKRKGSEGLIEDVILLGAPVSGDPKYWKPLTKVVAGKIVNGYARGDWLLKFLYRTASVTFNVAGLNPVKWDNRRMHNIDLSDIIDGHFDYCKNLDMIMKAVGVRTKDEIKPKSMKSSSSSSSSIQSINKPILVDHECQTDDELESDVHTQRNKRFTKKISKSVPTDINHQDDDEDDDYDIVPNENGKSSDKSNKISKTIPVGINHQNNDGDNDEDNDDYFLHYENGKSTDKSLDVKNSSSKHDGQNSSESDSINERSHKNTHQIDIMDKNGHTADDGNDVEEEEQEEGGHKAKANNFTGPSDAKPVGLLTVKDPSDSGLSERGSSVGESVEEILNQSSGSSSPVAENNHGIERVSEASQGNVDGLSSPVVAETSQSIVGGFAKPRNSSLDQAGVTRFCNNTDNTEVPELSQGNVNEPFDTHYKVRGNTLVENDHDIENMPVASQGSVHEAADIHNKLHAKTVDDSKDMISGNSVSYSNDNQNIKMSVSISKDQKESDVMGKGAIKKFIKKGQAKVKAASKNLERIKSSKTKSDSAPERQDMNKVENESQSNEAQAQWESCYFTDSDPCSETDD